MGSDRGCRAVEASGSGSGVQAGSAYLGFFPPFKQHHQLFHINTKMPKINPSGNVFLCRCWWSQTLDRFLIIDQLEMLTNSNKTSNNSRAQKLRDSLHHTLLCRSSSDSSESHVNHQVVSTRQPMWHWCVLAHVRAQVTLNWKENEKTIEWTLRDFLFTWNLMVAEMNSLVPNAMLAPLSCCSPHLTRRGSTINTRRGLCLSVILGLHGFKYLLWGERVGLHLKYMCVCIYTTTSSVHQRTTII